MGKSGFCEWMMDIDSVNTEESIGLKPKSSLAVIVKSDDNSVMEQMTVILASGPDKNMATLITGFNGKVRFENLCYGEYAHIQVLGSKNSKTCDLKKNVVIDDNPFQTITMFCN